MSLPNYTVSTVVKPVHKTDHYYHYGTPYLSLYIYYFGGKEPK